MNQDFLTSPNSFPILCKRLHYFGWRFPVDPFRSTRLFFLLPLLLLFLASSPPHPHNPSWYTKQLRILQTVLRESDLSDYSAERLVSYMKENGYNTVVINAGGVSDFFQNDLPLSRKPPLLGSRDIVAEVTSACHAAGFKVIARVDFRGVDKERALLKPDWFSKDEFGNFVTISWAAGLHSACYNSEYRRSYATNMIALLFRKYDIDGIWHNAPGVPGICHCQTCQERYLKTERDFLPKGKDVHSPEAKRYMARKKIWAEETIALMRKTVKRFGEEKSYAAEIFSPFEGETPFGSGLGVEIARKYFDFNVNVAFLNENKYGFNFRERFYPSTLVTLLKSLSPEKESVILTGGNGTAFRYVSEPIHDSTLWLWNTIASGGSFWNCYFMGNTPAHAPDRRNAGFEQEINFFQSTYEELLENRIPVADVHILYSDQTRMLDNVKESFGTELRGIVEILTAKHIPFAFIQEKELTSRSLEKIRLLILPNCIVLGDKECVLLSDWVKKGGNLIATHRTSLMDPQGKKRTDFGLKDIFGISTEDKIMESFGDCYQTIEKRESWMRFAEKTDLLFLWGPVLRCTINNATPLCMYQPAIANQPPEFSFVKEWGSPHPTLIRKKTGKGTTAYFADLPGMSYFHGGMSDTADLFAGIVEEMLSDRICSTDAPSSVQIHLTENRNGLFLGLVNSTSAPERPLKNLLPVRNISLKIRNTSHYSGGSFLNRNESPSGEIRVEKDYIHITINTLDDFQMIHLY